MKMAGKVLLFNSNEGRGIIITSKKEKIEFNVEEWDDFDTMPSLGLGVSFEYVNEKAFHIAHLENFDNFEEDEECDDDLEDEFYEDDEYDDEFDEDEEYDEDDEFEEEIAPREESLTVTMNISKAVENYFNNIENNIEKRKAYKKVDGRLDYLMVRRFLWTTFNNLSEIDMHIMNAKVISLANDLKVMAKIYDDFVIKTKHPPLAYQEVFLSCQSEYMKIKDVAEKTIEELRILRNNEKFVGTTLEVKKDELDENINTENFDILKGELKSLNGAYVDVVHMMAELDERYKSDMKLLTEFENEYRNDFYKLFSKASVKYEKVFLDILNAQAFLLDAKLWNQAKRSKAIKAHFHKASIEGEFNTKTYLKYYLDTLDSGQVSEDNRKLFELYDYLCSVHKEYVMIVVDSPQEAMDYEIAIKGIMKTVHIKSFIDVKEALKWAIHHSVKILIVEDELKNINVEMFLKYYKKYILVSPKIILIGNKPKSGDFTITKLFPKNVSLTLIAQNVKELLPEN